MTVPGHPAPDSTPAAKTGSKGVNFVPGIRLGQLPLPYSLYIFLKKITCCLRAVCLGIFMVMSGVTRGEKPDSELSLLLSIMNLIVPLVASKQSWEIFSVT